MQYEVTQIISYLVTAETPDEALEKWNSTPQIAKGVVAGLQLGDVEVLDERVEVNG